MKKRLKIMYFIAFIFIALFIGLDGVLGNVKLASAESENLLVNGSFETVENGTTPGWTFMEHAWAEDSDDNHEGNRRATMIYNADGFSSGAFVTLAQKVKVKANTNYEFSFYTKIWGDSEVQPLFIGYRNPNAADPYMNLKDIRLIDVGTNWEKVSFVFNTQSLTEVTVAVFTISINHDGKAGGYLFDNASLVETTVTNDGGLLSNGSLEDGNSMLSYEVVPNYNWATISWSSINNEPNNSLQGNMMNNMVYSAKDLGLQAGEFPSLWQDAIVEQNTEYKLVFYVKNWGSASFPNQPLYVGIRDMSSNTIWDNIGGGMMITNANGSYTRYTYTFNSLYLKNVRIAFYTPSITDSRLGGFHIDDIYLSKVGSNGNESNLIPDGQFNNGLVPYQDNPNAFATNGWTSFAGSTVETDDANAYSKSKVAKIKYDSSNGSIVAGEFPSIWHDVVVKSNTDYELSFYTKKVGNSSSPLYVGYRNPNGADKWMNVSDVAISDIGNEYVKKTFTFNSGTLDVVRIAMFAVTISTGNDSMYYIDDVELKQIKYAEFVDELPRSKVVDEECLLTNSSLEVSNVFPMGDPKSINNYWTTFSFSGLDRFVGNENANQGNANLFMAYSHQDLEAGTFPTFYQDVIVEPNTVYELSFFIKRFGDARDVAPLHYGIRDPYGADVWVHVVDNIKTEFSYEYEKVTCYINSKDMTTMRIAFYLVALNYDLQGGIGGYHVDDIRLFKTSKATNAKLTIDTDGATIGRAINTSALIDFENGEKDVVVPKSEYVQYSFVSSNEKVAKGDFEGNLIATGVGQAEIKLKVNCFGTIIESEPITLTLDESHLSDEAYIDRVLVSMDQEINMNEYVPMSIVAMLSDGSVAKMGGCIIQVQTDNKEVVSIKEINSVYYLLGLKNGTATIYVTVTYKDSTNYGQIQLNVNTTNFLRDPSFEEQLTNREWTVETNCGTDIDGGLTNKLAHSGYANFWAMAPVSWDANVPNDAHVRISQIVELEAGTYELSAFINRFVATGINGPLSSFGGTVNIGAVKLDDNGNETNEHQYSSYGTTYGAGSYNRISTVLNLSGGTYRVYISIDGDKDMGLGMQIDDMCLEKAIYSTQITATVGNDNQMEVGDMNKVLVSALFEDGTIEAVNGKVRIIVSDYSIAYVSSGYLFARNPGTVQVKVIVTLLDEEYITTFTVVVTGEPEYKPVETPKKGCKSSSALGLISLITLLGGTIALYKNKKGGNK